MAGGKEDDEDYMGDLSIFLPPENSSLSKKKIPSKVNTDLSVPKVKRPRTLSWQELRKLENDKKQHKEDEQTKASLNAAIPESNLGYQMLQRMGYKPGTTLGKEGSGLVEPVGLEIRRSRAGIGKETQVEGASRKEREAAERFKVREQEMVIEFGWRQKTQWREKKVVGDYRKAEAALAQLENRDVLEVKESELDMEKEVEVEEEEIITEEDLHEILMTLRKEHYYCLFCGCQYETEIELTSACPGLYEEDH